ncbi:glycosyltransferase family 4 protein [Uliginosibacterium sp. H3]|uniref:Glycosyltransferase family 4 protein n=1 Tax=Uliginosibacterium silvisoli TaxID=3114758 RepID=A0ABU6K3E4_9RHOO|nr:glycosyltransferase family 4 protein [Uliginosibacterium sp. H3]
MPHLVWLTENYPPANGGMAVSCDRIVRGLRAAGVVVDVLHFTRQSSGKPRLEIQRNGRHLAFPVGDDVSHSLNLLFEHLRIDPQREAFTHVVAFGGHLPLLAAPSFAAWLGLPLITLFRGNDFDAAIFSPQRRDIVREAIERAARVGVVSHDKAQRIRALHPAAEITWTPNSIDLADWSPLPSDRAQAARWRDTHVAGTRRVLGLFGQIKSKKGGLQLVDALLASGTHAHLHLLLVGDLEDDIHARLADEASPIAHTALPFSDRYSLLPHYCACDAIAIPSFYDGMPNVLLEAMGLGVPLLASTAGGMGDILVDGEHGFLFHPGDQHGCRHALARLAQASSADLRRMGEACLETARLFHPARETNAYLDVLRETMPAAAPHAAPLSKDAI